jgi:hypothetical protein
MEDSSSLINQQYKALTGWQTIETKIQPVGNITPSGD